MNSDILIGILIPFFGTALGAGLVLFMKREFNFYIGDFLTALAGGIMTAASVWSLIIPSIEESSHLGSFAFIPCCVGIVSGCIFMISLEKITVSLLGDRASKAAGYKSLNTILAVTIHNIPEGMAVGCVYASAIASESEQLFASAFLLSLGIAVQNIPEGAVISMPIYAEGKAKSKAFFVGILSGTVEPLGAFFTLLTASFIQAVLPYCLSFAAGTMLFVVSQEMLPEIEYKGKYPLTGIGFISGFMVMMCLDVALS